MSAPARPARRPSYFSSVPAKRLAIDLAVLGALFVLALLGFQHVYGGAQYLVTGIMALVLGALQEVLLAYLRRDVVETVPFWAMAQSPADEVWARAEALAAQLPPQRVSVEAMESLPGAGSLPGVGIPSFGLVLDGDRAAALRAADPPVVARVRDRRTFLDLRTVLPADDAPLAAVLARVLAP